LEHLDWLLSASQPLQWINDRKDRELTKITAVGANPVTQCSRISTAL